LQPGETEELIFSIPVTDLRYWDEGKSGWVLEAGTYTIEVGTSSRDLEQAEAIDL
jgi:beta-glucosidase